MTSAAGRRGHPRLFLVERAQPGMTASELEVAQRALVEISRRSTRNGAPLRYLRTLFLPGQSRCLSVFEALSADADNEYAAIDATIVRAHQHSAGARKKGATATRRSAAAGAG